MVNTQCRVQVMCCGFMFLNLYNSVNASSQLIQLKKKQMRFADSTGGDLGLWYSCVPFCSLSLLGPGYLALISFFSPRKPRRSQIWDSKSYSMNFSASRKPYYLAYPPAAWESPTAGVPSPQAMNRYQLGPIRNRPAQVSGG